MCYVRGHLATPLYCGEQFRFSVVDFESYEEKDAEKHALAAYFRSLSNGIERASRTGVVPLPLCGRQVRVARHVIPTANLVASPIPRVNLMYVVSRGEIFRATISDVWKAEDRHTLLWMIDTQQLQKDHPQGCTDPILLKFS